MYKTYLSYITPPDLSAVSVGPRLAPTRLPHQTSSGPVRRQSPLAEPLTGRSAHPNCRIRCPAAGVAIDFHVDGAAVRRARVAMAMTMSAGEGSDAGGEDPAAAGDLPRSQAEVRVNDFFF